MPDYQKIFNNEADKYDLLVMREDYKNNLLKSIKEIVLLEGKNVIEFGAGSGRLSFILSPHVKQITAFRTI